MTDKSSVCVCVCSRDQFYLGYQNLMALQTKPKHEQSSAEKITQQEFKQIYLTVALGLCQQICGLGLTLQLKNFRQF